MVNMNPYTAYLECLNKNKRIPELEAIIATDPKWSYNYALDVIKGPWKRGEEAISKDSLWSYHYANDIIKGPLESGEEIISNNSYHSYLYAFYVIKGPFEKCHPIIFNSEYRKRYIDFLRLINYDLNKISEWLI